MSNKIIELTSGMTFLYTPTGVKFKIKKVTDKNVSWYTGHIYPSAYNKKVMRMTHTSKRIFLEGIAKGLYIIE